MSFTRRAVLPLIAVVAMGGAALAADKMKYSDAAFDAAIKAGKPVLVDVSAPWCPTCRAQAPHLTRILADPKYKNVAAFVVDFDSQKDALRKLNARSQSTLIVYKGGKEIDRSVGDSDGRSIQMLLENLL